MQEKVILDSHIVDLIERSLKIEAIKEIRRTKNLGLKESKDLLDLYCAQNDIYERRRANKSIDRGRSPSRFNSMFVIAIILGAVYLFISLQGIYGN